MEHAIEEGNINIIKKLISKDKKKLFLTQRYNDGKTCLHLACEQGQIEIVKLFLKYNIDVNILDNYEQTPLHLSCENGYGDIISLLLTKNASINIKTLEGNTPLHYLVRHNPSEDFITQFYNILEEFKQLGVNLTKRNEQGETPLHLSVKENSEKCVMWLIRQEIDINISTRLGETPLHYAVRYGSGNLVSILIRAGVSITRCGVHGTARDVAQNENKTEIIDILDKLTDSSMIGVKSFVINGKETTLALLKEYEELYKKALEKVSADVKRYLKGKKNSTRVASLTQESSNYRFMLSIIEINSTPLLISEIDTKKLWSGNLRVQDQYVGEDIDTWTEIWCRVEDGNLSTYTGSPFNSYEPPTKLGKIILQDTFSIKVYENERKFSIIRYSSSPAKEEHYATETETDMISCLKTIVLLSRQPIEYFGSKKFISLVNKVKNSFGNEKTPKTLRRRSSKNSEMLQLRKRASRKHTVSSTPVSSSGSRIQHSLDVPSTSGVISSDGIILTTNFCSFVYGSIFSNILSMKSETKEPYSYYLSSGNLEDILNFVILHSHPKSFIGNIDVSAFYLSYYRVCSGDEILTALDNIWTAHAEMPWPKPYSEFSAASRLYAFIEGFVKFPFVLTDFEKELAFRSNLIEFYGKQILTPKILSETVDSLRNLLQRLKKTYDKSNINSMCDLNSLLGKSGSISDSQEFDITLNSSDVIASQITLINADLYKQMRVNQILDLRYQKLEDTALNKVHDFSNKIYLLVPTTILNSDNRIIQMKTLKKWIIIAEKLFQFRDYNSTIQVINGVTEVSVMRLKHLKEGLSLKWVDRFQKLRNYFDPEGSFKNYRKLPVTAPCIPFVGVALKDLTFTYDGNPDILEDGSINYSKFRLVLAVVKSLLIDKPEQIDYSFLKLNLQVAQSLLNATPLDQDSLFERSQQIKESMIATSDTCEDIPLLRKEIKQLREEVELLRETIQKKDKKIEKLKEKTATQKKSKKLHRKDYRNSSLPTISSPKLLSSSMPISNSKKVSSDANSTEEDEVSTPDDSDMETTESESVSISHTSLNPMMGLLTKELISSMELKREKDKNSY